MIVVSTVQHFSNSETISQSRPAASASSVPLRLSHCQLTGAFSLPIYEARLAESVWQSAARLELCWSELT